MTLSIVQRSLLEKLAQDNGFDVAGATDADWAIFTSTQVPLKLWLGAEGDRWRCAFSQPAVAEEIRALAQGASVPPPPTSAAAFEVSDLPGLHSVVRRAYQLSNTLPDELLHAFERQTKDLPQTTEIERLVVLRVGQNIFRNGLMRYWEGRCAVTGITEPELLRASHIKPWAKCDTAQERLNVFNGLLLVVHLDAAFDRGFITFDDAGKIIVSPCLSPTDAAGLGLRADLSLRRLEGGHRTALVWHRSNLFRTAPS
ncbi:MAG: HNH endonuclease [Myxococcaceae bacterium]